MMRHTKALKLLQSGIPLITFKDILGNADVKSFEVYVQIELDMKRKALEHADTPSSNRNPERQIPPDLPPKSWNHCNGLKLCCVMPMVFVNSQFVYHNFFLTIIQEFLTAELQNTGK